MSSKDTRNLILTFVILIAGMKILISLGLAYLVEFDILPVADDMVSFLNSLDDLFLVVFAPITVILIVVYIAQRRGEKQREKRISQEMQMQRQQTQKQQAR